jgi:hypothetical protein
VFARGDDVGAIRRVAGRDALLRGAEWEKGKPLGWTCETVGKRTLELGRREDGTARLSLSLSSLVEERTW